MPTTNAFVAPQMAQSPYNLFLCTGNLDSSNQHAYQQALASYQYIYDAIGNLTSKAGTAYIYGATNSGPHQAKTVGGQTYSYDSNGNLQSGGGRNYVWNAENQPSSISYNVGANTDSYSYDADGERVSRSVGVGLGQTITYYIGGLYEFDSVGNTRLLYQFGGQTIAQRTVNGKSALYYLHGDHLGSVSLMTGATGNLISSQEFKPWGEVRSGGVSQTTLNYTGQRKDDTGLLYYNARYYDPVLARFVSADNIGRETSKPQTLNTYTYVTNNPIRYIDPTGHYQDVPQDGTVHYYAYTQLPYQVSKALEWRRHLEHLTPKDLVAAYNDQNERVTYDKDGHPLRVQRGTPQSHYPNHFREVDESLRALEDEWLVLDAALADIHISASDKAKIEQARDDILNELATDMFFMWKGDYPHSSGDLNYAKSLVLAALGTSVGTCGNTAGGGYISCSRILHNLLQYNLADGWLDRMTKAAGEGQPQPPDMNNGGCLTSIKCR